MERKDFPEMMKIGYHWSRDNGTKSRFNKTELKKLLEERNLKLVRLNFDKPLEGQGPFALIIHKMVNLIVKGKLGNQRAKKYHQKFKEYIEKHPETIIIDPLPSIESLISRLDQYNLLDEYICGHLTNIFIPNYIELVSQDKEENLQKLKEKGIDFPIICKPLLAQGTTRAHKLTIMLNSSGLAGLKPPCIAQEFINHNAVLYKMYIIGDTFNVIEKPSIKNINPGKHPNINFTSHICKNSEVSSLTKMDSTETIEQDFGFKKNFQETIFQSIPAALGLKLLGIDIIVERRTGRHAIIDVNLFPGYAEVKDLMPRFRDMIFSKLHGSSTNSTSALTTVSALSQEEYNPELNFGMMDFFYDDEFDSDDDLDGDEIIDDLDGVDYENELLE